MFDYQGSWDYNAEHSTDDPVKDFTAGMRAHDRCQPYHEQASEAWRKGFRHAFHRRLAIQYFFGRNEAGVGRNNRGWAKIHIQRARENQLDAEGDGCTCKYPHDRPPRRFAKSVRPPV
jgi:hypothetical protein